MADKVLQWLASSRSDVRAFPRETRRLLGVQLRRVQQGLEPSDWKPVAAVGPGVREIRVRTALEHRVLYVAKFAEAVYVLHAFEKRTRKIESETSPANSVRIAPTFVSTCCRVCV